MKTFVVLLLAVAGAFALVPNKITGTTPPPVDCPNSMCDGKYDGNYEYKLYRADKYDYVYNPHYFLQCSNGLAYCQACWPLRLEYSEKCDQCLYSKHDTCVTTQPWKPEVRYHCPDLCPSKGYEFSGNIADKTQPRHYVGCWHGITMGCVNCPAGLYFNEKWNACLYEGKFKTKPDYSSAGYH